jgi:hypothetical protein
MFLIGTTEFHWQAYHQHAKYATKLNVRSELDLRHSSATAATVR